VLSKKFLGKDGSAPLQEKIGPYAYASELKFSLGCGQSWKN